METRTKIALNTTLFVFKEKGDIPAVELDLTTGKRYVMVFTSEDKAKKYCWLRNPSAVGTITPLSRTTHEVTGDVLHSGLIRLARILNKDFPDITDFVIDPPGTKSGTASFLSVRDAMVLGIKAPEPELTHQEFLDRIIDDEENSAE